MAATSTWTASVEDRPWTAEIQTPIDGFVPKYNIPVDGSLANATAETLAMSTQSTKSTKQLKAEWAASCAKGVDFTRPAADIPRTAARDTACEPIVQVRQPLLTLAHLPSSHIPRGPHGQGFFSSRHPMNKPE